MKHQQETYHEYLSATVTAHADDETHLVMVEVTAAQMPLQNTGEASVRLALVLDRSGSMRGPKLDATSRATARLIRSLKPEDRVALVTYDHRVNVLTELSAPHTHVASLADRIFPGGQTNLYGGWMQGAELLGNKGNLVLLSDGLANTGMFVDAEGLQSQASYAYKQNQITTTTIGVGKDYDEALMAGMAMGGGGNHYFAQDVDAIMEAFTQERFALGAIALEQVTLTWDNKQQDLGLLFSGEVKRFVIPTKTLPRTSPILDFTVRATAERISIPLGMPTKFGRDDKVTLEHLFAQVAELHERMVNIRNSHSAAELWQRVNQALKQLEAHPLAHSEIAWAMIGHLRTTASRLDRLVKRYDARSSSIYRKSSLQAAYTIRNPRRGFSSSSSEDYSFARSHERYSSAPRRQPVWRVDRDTLALAPLASWQGWEAAPVSAIGDKVRIVMVNPRDAFLSQKIEREIGKTVYIIPYPMEPDHIERLLKGSRLTTKQTHFRALPRDNSPKTPSRSSPSPKANNNKTPPSPNL